MRIHGVGPNTVAREVALLTSQAPFVPIVLAHTPGIANVTADALSRLAEPNSGYSIPDTLRDASQDVVPTNGKDYFRCLLAPP